MEIDHFNPTLVGAARNNYNNLFLATRHCNGSKSDTWPARRLRKMGVRLLNPCTEMDYGPHIVEHPLTHRLIGLTPAGDYQITTCDLNAPHLVQERRDRAGIHSLLEEMTVQVSNLAVADTVVRLVQELRLQFSKMIPLIPYLSKDHPKYIEEIQMYNLLQQEFSIR